jgi:hypothetical protein
VLTASASTQFAWEGDEVIGEAESSVFTHYLIQGLQTGDADAAGDGRVTLDELYDYVYSKVVDETPKQTPGKWTYKQQGDIVIARNPKPVAEQAQLPAKLHEAIESPFASVREGAVRELDRLLMGSHMGFVRAAHSALTQLREDDSRRVSTAAKESLRAYAEARRAKEGIEVKTEKLIAEEPKVERVAAREVEADRRPVKADRQPVEEVGTKQQVVDERPAEAVAAAAPGLPTSRTATTALLLALLSVTILPVLASFPAIIMGRKARREIQQNPGKYSGEMQAQIAIILGWAGIVLVGVSLACYGFSLYFFDMGMMY